jgi:FkbM family methyltransferase
MGSRPKGRIQDWIGPHLKPGQTGVDVGASDGTFCEYMADAVGPTGKVIAIEPLLEHQRKIRERCLPQLTLYCGAVRNAPGDMTLYECGQESSLYEDAVNSPRGKSTVTTWRLDDLVDHAHLIKMDAQGGEVAILDGARRLVQTCPTWIVELWPRGLTAAKATGQQLVERFWDAGFTLRWADHELMTPANYDAWEGSGQVYVNILATK